MKVILLKELKGRGGEGDVIDVARGFANNYLLRQGYAVLATKGNLKQLEARKANIAKREEVRISKAEELKAKLDSAKVVVDAQVGEEGQLFGSVTNAIIAKAIEEQLEETIDKRRIELATPIKTAGKHEVLVSLYREIKAELSVIVGSEDVAENAEGKEAEAADASAEGAQAETTSDAESVEAAEATDSTEEPATSEDANA